MSMPPTSCSTLPILTLACTSDKAGYTPYKTSQAATAQG